jgi:hypothetical protein
VQFTEGTPLPGTIASATETSAFRFNAQEGELFTLRTASPQFEGDMVLIDPSGTTLETVPFNTSDDAWLPYRAPVTGTYTVEISATTGTGNFAITFISYGLESATFPDLFQTTAPATGSTEYYFFAEAGELMVADVVYDNTNVSGAINAQLQLLISDETWSDGVTPVGSEPTLKAARPGDPGLLAAAAPATSIYRLRVQRAFGAGDVIVRLDKLLAQLGAATLTVGESSTCTTPYDVSIPRLASLGVGAGGTIEICEGTYVEYGTLSMGPGGAATIRGTSASSVLQGAGTPGSTSFALITLDGAANALIENLEMQTVESSGFDTQRPFMTFEGLQSTDTHVRNVIATAGTSAAREPIFRIVSPVSGLLVEDLTATGQVSLGTLTGSGFVFRRANLATGPNDRFGDAFIIGDGTLFEQSTIGDPAQVLRGRLIFQGNDVEFIENTVLFGHSVGVEASPFSPFANATIEDNVFDATSTPPSGSSLGAPGRLVRILNITGFSLARNRFIDPSDDLSSSTIYVVESSGSIVNNRMEVLARDIVRIENTDDVATTLPVDIFNNTFVIDGDNSDAIRLQFTPFSTDPPPVSVVNNIFVNRTSAAPTSSQNAICANRGALQTIDFNLYDNFSSPPCATWGFVVGPNGFVGSAGTDMLLKLTAGSAAIDAGTATGAPTEDFEGDARPQGAGVDIGADEF